jgi:A/G-specific adenine glycosylase
MLQQTQVATVVPFYERFIGQFGNFSELAAASEEEVLAAWAGLGYYRRARNLHSTAKEIVGSHDGNFPECYNEVVSLPGIGRYTASAVLSFAFNKPLPIVEANSARVLARLLAIEEDITKPKIKKSLWEAAEELLDRAQPRLFNYAIMELGSLICTPVSPGCDLCPVRKFCKAAKNDMVYRIPVLPKPREMIRKAFGAVIVVKDNHFLLRRIPANEWHAGLFEFPKIEHGPDDTPGERKASAARLLNTLGITSADPVEYARIKYTVTHHKIDLYAWLAGKASFEGTELSSEYQWYAVSELPQIPMGSAQKRIVNLLLGNSDFFGSLR